MPTQLSFLLVGCPPGLTCDHAFNGIHISSDQRLNEVPPVLPLDAINVDFSLHVIANLRNEEFKNCFNVTSLNLTRSSIRTIQPLAFNDLHKLKSLYLSGNLIENINFEQGTFSGLPNLDTLRIEKQNEKNGELAHEVTNEAFKTFVKRLPITLKQLYVDIPCDDTFTQTLRRFFYLTELGIFRAQQCQPCGDDGCGITNSSLENLKNMPITKLRIQFGWLGGIQPLTFSWFTKLKSLDLSGTRGLSVAKFSPAFFGLRDTQLSELILTSFQEHLHYPDETDDMVELNSSFFGGSYLPYLKKLYLDKTGIRGFAGTFEFQIFRNLKHISVAGNSLDGQAIQQLTRSTKNIQKLQVLDFRFQRKSTENAIQIQLSPSMTTLYLSGFMKCHEYHDLDTIDLYGANNLTLLEMRGNFLRQLRRIYIENPNAKQLLTVDLSHNKLTFISSELFTDSISHGLRLDGLFLSHNFLGKQLGDDHGEAFLYCQELRKLDLSYNGIKSISRSTFESLTELELLKLDNNLLDSIKFMFSHMNYLVVLDLSNNRLFHVNSEALDQLSMISARHQNLFVNTTGNRFTASCDDMPSLTWIQDHEPSFYDFNISYCYSSNGDIALDCINDFDSVVQHLDSRCSADTKSKIKELVALVGVVLLEHLIIVLISLIMCSPRCRVALKECCRRRRNRGEHQDNVEGDDLNQETPV